MGYKIALMWVCHRHEQKNGRVGTERTLICYCHLYTACFYCHQAYFSQSCNEVNCSLYFTREST
jgi:hypothetical protein